MKVISLVIAFISLTSTGYLAAAQSVTLYTAGPDGLTRGIAKSFTEKNGIKVDPYQGHQWRRVGASGPAWLWA